MNNKVTYKGILNSVSVAVALGALTSPMLALAASGTTTTTSSGPASTANSSPSAPSSTPVTAPPPPIASDTSVQSCLANAKTLAKANNPSAAEAALTVSNVMPLNSAGWHVETAQKLLWLATDTARSGSISSVSGFGAHRDLHLQQASALTTDIPTQARNNALSGFIYLRLLGNPTSALASYQAAAKQAPTDQAITQALTRLQNSLAILQAKIAANVKK